MKVVIEDPWLGSRELSEEEPDLALIKDQHKLLCAFRDDGRVPAQALLDDIATYDRLIQGGQAECKGYLDWRHHGDKDPWSVRPEDYGRMKGWIK